MALSQYASRRVRLVLTLLIAGACSADSVSDGRRAERDTPDRFEAVAEPAGRMLVLPGVYNTRFQLDGFVELAEEQLPEFEIDVRRWGTPLLPLRNLRAHERNLETAAELAAEIAAWRAEHPDDPFYLVGYSGGGGMAALIVGALPDGVRIDRLVLVAPAISPSYPLERKVLPHVRELVANYASERDLQVGWGTRTFGTIDREHVDSAGAVGFDVDDPKLVQWYWSPQDRSVGQRGNHIAYLDETWQEAALLPAVDPHVTADALAAQWAARLEEDE